MDIDRIYQLMGSGLKRLYGYYVKRPMQRFNVDNRAEKVIEKQQTNVPKMAPRHERTDQLFKQITQNNPQFREELNAKREDLLKRLSTVKVVSIDREINEEEIRELEERRQRLKDRLPVSHKGVDIPMHAYVEPAYVPPGRISLIRALDFIGKHAKSPEQYDSHTIAIQHKLNEEEVENVLNYFKPFYKENITDPVEDTEAVLGISKQKWSQMTTLLKPKSLLNQMKLNNSPGVENSTGDPVSDKSFSDKKQQ